jgi:pyridinium-3,5-bisthiocarboxylic acid mononucleotide nickel chelatase
MRPQIFPHPSHRHLHAHSHEHPQSHGGEASHSHSHAHDDDPDHDHDHDHDHGVGAAHQQRAGEHPHGTRQRPELERGAGEGRLLFLDAQSGIAGDMTIAALVDLGVPLAEVERVLGCLPLAGFRVELHSGFAGAIGASHFDVHVEAAQPERNYAEIDALLRAAPLPPRTQSLARAIFRRLAEAEAEVHRVDLEEVHFHEVGAVDAIVDIVGAAACFDFLGADVVASPLPLGRGSVECRHGRLPLPAPASLLCLRGVPTYDAGIEAELVTPTGAAIVATVAGSFASWPSFIPEHVGWGKGTRELPDRPNALRVVLGQPWASPSAAHATHVVVEANVDDLTGELAGHALAALLRAGALDAWLTPIQMKKGRPGLILSALCPINAADQLGAVLLRETSSLGYRKSPVTRGERPRRMIEVQTEWGPIPIKVSTGPWGSPQIKPEFDVCAARAEAHGVPVREVLQVALTLARAQLGSG